MLKNKAVKLRALEPADVELLYNWENDPEVWLISHTLVPFSRHILTEYVNAPQDIFAARQLRLMVDKTEDDKTIGCIDLFDFDPLHQRAGVGILIADKTERGNGFAGNALKLMIQYAFETLALHQLYCNITSGNEKSLHLFKKHNFVVAGNKKEWLKSSNGWQDEYLLQLIRT